mgnify:CR=1 FL=1
MSNSILEVSSLTKCFGALRAVDGVDMKFNERKITLIIGPNGSGKTTLINCITGIYKPDDGKVYYKGEDITAKPPHEIVKKGLVRTFQIPMPFQRLTVLENLLVSYQYNPGESVLWSLFKSKWLKNELEAVEKAFEILTLLELDHLWNRPAYELSGGQLKLLEIGRALMTDAKTILMDEPAGSVNPVLAHNIFEHIVELRNKLGLTFVVIEHRLDIAAKYADYAYAMASGKVISHGEPEKVLNDPKVIESYLG